MCGIFGILDHAATEPPPHGRLEETARRLRHRGPDGQGVHAEPGVGLVHTRLSLVDLSERSDQPFWDRTGRYGLLYNGELYDYEDLRARLMERGVTFRTTSDTEVLLEALLCFGVDEALPQLEGMFAFALYDSRDRSLVLARDRFGIKPLFVHDGPTSFVFSSEVGAMAPWLSLEPDPLMTSAYLQGLNGPMSGRSFYKDVTIVPPGSVVRVRLGQRATFERHLVLREFVDEDMTAAFDGRPREELVDHVEELLLRSVESQLRADVPGGAFCSGGVDSSLIMSMAARFHDDLRVFHADITGPLSERRAAQRLSDHLKLDLRVVPVGDEDFVREIPDVVAHFGAPFANPTMIPILMVSRLVRDSGIKAVLTGEASDECFLGYEWLVPNVRTALSRLPGRILKKIVPGRRSGTHSPSRGANLIRDLASRYETSLGPPALTADSDAAYHAGAGAGLASSSELSYILRTLLYRNDTMGMAASIESRFPFLDSRLVKVSANLPYDAKIRFSPTYLDPKHPFYVDKWIVRQVAARYIPPELSHRHKGMFPTNAFQRMDIDDEFFDGSMVAEWYGLASRQLRHVLGQANASLRLRLMILEAWMSVCIAGAAKATLSDRLSRHVTVRPL